MALKVSGLSYFIELLRLLPSVSEVNVLDEPIQCPSDLGRGAAWNVCGQGSLHLDYLRGTFMYKHRYLQNTQAYCKHNFAGATEKNWVFWLIRQYQKRAEAMLFFIDYFSV